MYKKLETMSKQDVLYVKGMEMSESDEDDENVWDDRKLNDAYDKAIKIADVEIAKRIAMSTNTQSDKENKQAPNKNSKKPQPKPKPKATKINWRVGMPCRALYDEDGLEYEAYVVSIINESECIVQFLGYNNLQIVALDTLEPLLDTDEHTNKPEHTTSERDDDGFESQSPNGNDGNTAADIQDSIKELYKRNKKSGKKKNKQKSPNNFTLPDIPMPDMSTIRNLGLMEMPLPPPPPQLSAVHNEQEAVSSMLLSWYMSGYYTGLYQGMKRAKEEARHGK